jgi:DNA ligase 1
MKSFRPTKPYKIVESDLNNLRYPVYVQSKLDGFRCVLLNGVALSYSLKLIRNTYTRAVLEAISTPGWNLDGELTLVGNNNFQAIQSAFNSFDGEPDFIFNVFDRFKDPRQSFENRFITSGDYNSNFVCPVSTYLCDSKLAVTAKEAEFLMLGYEGIIIRSPTAPYKFGRSTLKEGYLLALKRFTDAEAEIIDAYPLERNTNTASVNAHGLMERSAAGVGKVEDNLLGGFTVRGINGRFKGVVFNVGSGFTERQRREYWAAWKLKRCILGAPEPIIKYKFQDVGSKDKPRQPIFLGFRCKDDL